MGNDECTGTDSKGERCIHVLGPYALHTPGVDKRDFSHHVSLEATVIDLTINSA